MDPDIPAPSIEQDDLPPLTVSRPGLRTRRSQSGFDRASLDSASETPLPASSPQRSPRKTPKPQRFPLSPQPKYVPSSPASKTTTSDGQASPVLHRQRSTHSLGASRGVTPSGARRVSSSLNHSSPGVSTKAIPAPKPKPAATAATVAQDYFRRELSWQKSQPDYETAVFVHDACYGHRFSRPRTSKAALGTIVERPERIHATILGASAAYVRLGERHMDGRAGPHPSRDPGSSLPAPFMICKTSRFLALDHPAVTQVHGSKWMEELQIMCDSAEAKLAMTGKELVRPIGYGKDEKGQALPRLHEGDLYLCSESLNALQGCLGGVCDAVDKVLTSNTTRRAFVCIRPPGHHCSSNFPSGFCWLNNVHVGISYAAMNHGLTHAAIIDFDLHHGDGSQTVAWDHNRRALDLPKNAAPHKKTPIGYFSLHDINSYPCEMGDEDKVRNASLCIENAHGQSIWNVHLEPWKTPEDFWRLYESRYSVLLEKTRTFLHHHTSKFNAVTNGPPAKAAIFLSAGFDASEWEGEGMQRHKVNVPTDFYARFTADVVKLAQEEGLGCDGRVISVLEGGYSDRALASGALSHISGLTTQLADHSSDGEMGGHPAPMTNGISPHQMAYSPGWWARHHLELLEARVHAHDPPLAPKMAKEKTFGNYTSPTQASTAKMTDQARERRSLSLQLESRLVMVEEPEEPPPAVDWATAAYELSRLIIPSDRQTLSCRHDELNAEATRARRERQSTIGLPDIPDERMQLRDRRTRHLPLDVAPARPPSRSDKRRTTIAVLADLPDAGLGANGDHSVAPDRPRRRSSGASSIVSGFQGMQIGDQATRQPSSADGRPSSQSGSVIPAKTVKLPAVKKTRVAAGTKPAVKAKSSPKKTTGPAPAALEVPAMQHPASSNGATPVEEIRTGERAFSQARAGSAGSAKAEDLDRLAGGVKKMSIKLKVRSPEEVAAQETATAADAKAKKPRAPRKPAAPKAPKQVKTGSSKAVTPDANGSISLPDQGSSVLDQPAHLEKLHLPGDVARESALATNPAEPSVASTAPTWEVLSTATAESDKSAAVPDATAPLPQPSAFNPMAISRVLDTVEATPNTNPSLPVLPGDAALPNEGSETPWEGKDSESKEAESAAPASAPPTLKKTRVDLPVFTSSSPIPFSNSRPGTGKSLVNRDGRIGLGGEQLAGLGIKKVTERKEHDAGAAAKKEDATLSVWDVPDTPQK